MPVARCKVMLYRNMAAYEKVSKVGLQELATALTIRVQTWDANKRAQQNEMRIDKIYGSVLILLLGNV